MNNNYKEKCVSAIFMLLIISYSFSVSYQILLNKDAIEKRYHNMNETNLITKLLKSVKLELENYSTEELGDRNMYIHFNGMFSKILNQNFFIKGDTIVKLKNGHLTSVNKSNVQNMQQAANSMLKYKEQNDSLGIDTLYVQAPAKLPEENDVLPNGVIDYANENANRLLSILRENNMDILDLREKIRQDNLNYYDCFYKTDHHWTVETALWATRVLSAQLNKNYGMSIETKSFEETRFEKVTYANYSLGSWGRKLGLGYSSPENFSYLFPRDKTSLNIKINSMRLNKTGAFKKVFMSSLKNLSGDDFYLLNSVYGSYLYGIRDETQIENLRIDSTQKILLIGDSFSRPLTAFLSLAVKDIALLDLRIYKGSVREYTKAFEPEVVVIMYNPGLLNNRRDGAQYYTYE